MTKICGVVCNEEGFDTGSCVQKMVEASWQPLYLRREIWSDRHAGLGHLSIGAVNLEEQPVLSGRNAGVGVYCGKIFDFDKHIGKLAGNDSNPEEFARDIQFLLEFIQRYGKERLHEINGIFSMAIWDPSQKKLLLTGDRYGFRPLYYYHDIEKNALVFSSDIKGILATGLPHLKVNWKSVNVFLHFGHMLGDDTLFGNIYRLPPASVLTFKDNTVQIESYWELTDLPINESLDIKEAVEGSVSLFRQAIRRRLNQAPVPHVVFLSGGQDSRHIAAEIANQKSYFEAYTTSGFKPALEDKLIARQVAQALGIKHTYVSLPRQNFLSEYWPRAHRLSDFEVDLHEWILPTIDHLPSIPHINFDGILGDTCLSSVFLNAQDYSLVRKGRLEELAYRVLNKESCPPVFHPSITIHLDRKILFEAIYNQFIKFKDHPNLINFSYLSGRTRRAISLFAFKLVIEKVESFFPFADNDFFDFAMSIPPEHKLDGKLHRRILDFAYPHLKTIPTTKEINPLDYRIDEINYLGQKRKYLWKGLLKILGKKTWVFNKRTSIPRLFRDIAMASSKRNSQYFLCNPAYSVLAHWFETYFPDGMD